MQIRLWTWTVVLGVLATSTAGAAAQDAEHSPEAAQAIKYLQGLRERGYHDLALDYLNDLRADPETPADLKSILDYEEGRGLLEEATRSSDLEGRRKLLEEARVKLDGFAKANPNHPLAAEALVQSARMLFERAQTAVLQANELKDDKEKAPRLAEARASFEQSRAAYTKAIDPLKQKYATYPAFIPNDDPRHAEKQRTQIAMMNAELQRALVEYEEAQTYPPGDAKRNALLDKGLAAFDDIYKRYRTQLAGFFARMWQAKSYEEQGKLTEAMGIYKELMEHQDPALAPLQRKVQYFQIIVDGKRKEHALAVDRAADWLNNYKNFQRSDEGIGVKLELAKNILAQLPELKESDQTIAVNRATALLGEVVRYYSPFKPEALALLQKYKPKAAGRLNNLAGLSYEDAYAQGEGAISTHEWDRAIALFKQAVEKADPTKDAEKANKARYMMAFAYFEAEQYYAANVIAEHIARNYPSWSLSVKAAEIGIASLTQAYNAYLAVDRSSDLTALADLCKYTTATWPDSDQADAAWMTLGQINIGLADSRGRANYPGAYKAFESIRENSPKRQDALVLAASAHRRNSYYLRDDGKTAEADAELQKAQELLQNALKARRDAQVPQTDPAFLANANALADLQREMGNPKDALALLAPIAKALGGSASGDLASLQTEMLTIMLRSHIADGQADAAIADMKALETVSSGSASLNQLYFELGRTLKKELETLQAQKYTTKLNQTKTAYAQFLDALANSKSGQTFDTLLFAATGLLELGQAARATTLLQDTLKKYATDKDFLKSPGAEDRLTIVRLRLAESLRKQKKFAESQTVGDEVIQLAPRSLEPRFERGLLYEDWAATDPSKWSTAYNHWRQLSSQLERTRPRRIEYYDALLHVARALEGMGKKKDAAALLKSVMTLSPAVGDPEHKAKFQAAVSRLTGK
jgi:hypothetical protein